MPSQHLQSPCQLFPRPIPIAWRIRAAGHAAARRPRRTSTALRAATSPDGRRPNRAHLYCWMRSCSTPTLPAVAANQTQVIPSPVTRFTFAPQRWSHATTRLLRRRTVVTRGPLVGAECGGRVEVEVAHRLAAVMSLLHEVHEHAWVVDPLRVHAACVASLVRGAR